MKTIEIKADKCIGCGRCVHMCPRKILKMEGDKAVVVNARDCDGLYGCIYTCPADAIRKKEMEF